MDESRVAISASLVRRLIASQFPQWATLEVRPVDVQGWDNRTFRLGDQLSVRLPSAERYAAQVRKEQRWLARLAPELPLAIPAPVALGDPQFGFPWSWSVNRWLDGECATTAHIADRCAFAERLAHFLLALQRIDPAGGPPPGAHNFMRGAPLEVYDAETRRAIARLGDRIDAGAATSVWKTALAQSFGGTPVWLHGDVSPTNLLVRDGALAAVIDFGGLGVGDPACDLAIAWTFFSEVESDTFLSALALGDGARARGRGWALWKALITLAQPSAAPRVGSAAERVVLRTIADHARAA